MDLDKKYRPQIFDEVIGQDIIVKSLTSLLKEGKLPHSFIFSGISGSGKTTLARILSKEVGCTSPIEVDAATYTGIDDVRQISDGLQYAGIGNTIKFVIMDEAHALSKQAWQALLKIVEEPPKHVYFVFCTTEVEKIPAAIKTRCHSYRLQPVSETLLVEWLTYIVEVENIITDAKIISAIASKAEGSPRQAIVYLSQVAGITVLEEALSLMESLSSHKEVIELCRALCKEEPNFSEVKSILLSLKGQSNAEAIRMQIQGYFQACALNAKNINDFKRFSAILDVFSKPAFTSHGLSEIIISVAQLF